MLPMSMLFEHKQNVFFGTNDWDIHPTNVCAQHTNSSMAHQNSNTMIQSLKNVQFAFDQNKLKNHLDRRGSHPRAIGVDEVVA